MRIKRVFRKEQNQMDNRDRGGAARQARGEVEAREEDHENRGISTNVTIMHSMAFILLLMHLTHL